MTGANYAIVSIARAMPLAAPMHSVNDAALETIPSHRVDQARGEHGARRTDGVSVRDGSPFDIDEVLGQA